MRTEHCVSLAQKSPPGYLASCPQSTPWHTCPPEPCVLSSPIPCWLLCGVVLVLTVNPMVRPCHPSSPPHGSQTLRENCQQYSKVFIYFFGAWSSSHRILRRSCTGLCSGFQQAGTCPWQTRRQIAVCLLQGISVSLPPCTQLCPAPRGRTTERQRSHR